MFSDKTQQMLWNCESQASGCDFASWCLANSTFATAERI